jgi:hypothetical protein
VVDGMQSRLYTLRTNGDIEVYDVAGTNWNLKCKFERRSYGASLPVAESKVVSLGVVGPNESKNVSLVAVTANGMSSLLYKLTCRDEDILQHPVPIHLHPSSPSEYPDHTFIYHILLQLEPPHHLL